MGRSTAERSNCDCTGQTTRSCSANTLTEDEPEGRAFIAEDNRSEDRGHRQKQDAAIDDDLDAMSSKEADIGEDDPSDDTTPNACL